MATIDDITDIGNSGDQVSHLWVNDVGSKISANISNINTLNTNVTTLQTLRDEFKVSLATGLTVSYLGGSVRLSSGTYAVVANGSIVLPASSTSFVFVNSLGVVATSTARPVDALEMAVVTTDATSVTNISPVPKREAFNRPQKLIEAVKNGVANLNPDGISYGIPGWTLIRNEGGIMNAGSGVITVPASWRIRAEATVNVSSPNATVLSGKLSLYNGGTELKILDGLSVPTPLVAPSGMILNGSYETREDQTLGGTGTLTLQLQFRQGTAASIAGDNNTVLRLWRVE
jgi:hypothetical protein